MSILRKSINNVLKQAIESLGKQDVPKKEEPQKADVPPQESDTLQILNRIYFYAADPNKKISFSNLNDILTGSEQSDKEELVNNLKGGNTADFHADYFKWISLYVKAASQKDQTKVVVYRFDLNPWGTKASEGTMVKSNVAGFNPPSPNDMVRNTAYKLFATINEIPDMINLSQGPEAIYSTDNVSDQFAEKLLKARAETTVSKKMNYDNFKTNIFGYFRIWIPITVNELRYVDGSKPTTDQIPAALQRYSPGQYKGGGDFFKRFMAAGRYKITEEKPTEVAAPELAQVPTTPLKAPMKEPAFSPVTKMAMSDSEEKESKIREINKDDPNVNQYIGDFSIMQDLVRRQHKKMKIRKQAAVQTGPAGTVYSPTKIVTPVPIGNKKETEKVTKPLVDMSKKMEDLMKGQTNTGVQQTTQSVSTGMGKYSSENVKNVLNKYFKA